ncbi:MAG: hypothetical protein KF745_03630 [Phycisphaeraceae bacterium]|nr:hypothetical protein [Phycisphaeraceae bacterium]
MAMSLRDNEWLFSRVINTSAVASPLANDWLGTLLYVFKYKNNRPLPPQRLFVNDLLMPPVIVSGELWHHRLVELIDNRGFFDGELFDIHCFRSLVFTTQRYYDEHGVELASRVEPCGLQVLYTAQGLAKEITNAIGGLRGLK